MTDYLATREFWHEYDAACDDVHDFIGYLLLCKPDPGVSQRAIATAVRLVCEA